MTIEALNKDGSGALLTDTCLSVTPLDAQFGVFPMLSMPETLRDALKPGPNRIYGLISGIRIADLEIHLSNSDEHSFCLYEGEQRERFAESAPWLVDLTDGGTFTRSLFTDGEAPHDFWHEDPVVILSSPLDIADLARHLKKFIRLQDNSGDWYYLRFWEADTSNLLMDWLKSRPAYLHKFMSNAQNQDLVIDKVAIPNSLRSECRILTYSVDDHQTVKSEMLVIDDDLKTVLAELNRTRSFKKCCSYVKNTLKNKIPDLADIDATTDRITRLAWVESYSMGMTSELGRCRLAVAMMWLGHRFLDDPKYAYIGLSRQALRYDGTGEQLFETIVRNQKHLFVLKPEQADDMIRSGALKDLSSLEQWLWTHDAAAMDIWGDAFHPLAESVFEDPHPKTPVLEVFLAYAFGIGFRDDPITDRNKLLRLEQFFSKNT